MTREMESETKFRLLLFLSVFFVAVTPTFGEEASELTENSQDETSENTFIIGVITKVIDGDTLQYCPNLEENCEDTELVEIDLWGMDAPELEPEPQFHAIRAQTHVEETLLDETVVIELMGTQSEVNENEFAKIYTLENQGEAVNLQLLMDGIAWSTVEDEDEKKAYALAEEFARERFIGLWREIEPIAPWLWLEQQSEDQESP